MPAIGMTIDLLPIGIGEVLADVRGLYLEKFLLLLEELPVIGQDLLLCLLTCLL